MSDHAHASLIPADTPPHGTETHEKVDHRKDYFRIFWVLGVLTILEIGAAKLPVDRRLVAALLIAFAVSKAAFVGLYYMHLKYEKRLLLWVAATPFPLAALYALFLGMDAAEILRALTAPWK